MKNHQKIIRRVIAIVLLLFAIWNTFWQYLDYAFSDSAYLTSSEKMWVSFTYLNFIILLAMGIFPFFSRYRSILIIAILLAIVGVIFWILGWGWQDPSTNLTNIIFLLVTTAFDCWQFIANKKEGKISRN